jgi:VWFA-related protein
MRFSQRLPIILALLFSSLPCTAQTNQVFVTASLQDKRDLLIENLEQQEIEILENNQPRRVEFLARDEVPAIYGILFDRSLIPENEDSYRVPGMPPQLSSITAKSLAYEMVDKYLGKQTVWVGTYERALNVLLDFSTDGFRAKDVIQRLAGRRSMEESFLYAALYSAIMKMKDRHEKRRVLIVFMSALDPDTAGKMKPLKNLLASSNVEVFFISFASRTGISQPGMSPLMSRASVLELAQITAGEAFFGADYREHPDDISRRILNVLRTLYTFGFQSNAPPDKPARLTIRCLRPGSKVRSRQTVPAL